MAANLTYAQVETRVMNQLRIPVSNTVEQAKIQALINQVYRDIAAKQDWWWLLKRAAVTVTPRITVTASVTLNSTVGVFSTAPAQNAVAISAARFLLIPDGTANDLDALYRVTSTHAAGTTAFALEDVYTNATSTAQAGFLYQDAYPLPTDAGKVLQVRRYGRSLPLRRAGLEEMGWLKLTDRTTGTPEIYAVYDEQTTGDPTTQRLLQVHPFPDTNYHRLEIYYKQTLNTELSGATRPLIPDDYAQVLIYGALARGYPIFLNDRERGQEFKTLFNDILALMAAQQREYDGDKSGVSPDDSYYNFYGRRRRRRGGTNTTLGSWFDRLPNRP